MTSPPRARLAVRGLLLASACFCAFSRAETAPPWAEPCASVATPPSPARPRSLEAWQYNDPLAALGWVCDSLRRGPVAVTALIDLAESLTAASRPEAAAKLLEGLDAAAAAAAPEDRVRLELARFGLARNRGRMAVASEHAERAISLAGAMAAPPADLLARALLARSAAARALNKPGALALAAASTRAAEDTLNQAGLQSSWRISDVFNERTMIAHANDDLQGAVRWAEHEVRFIRSFSGPDAPGQLDALATLGAITSLRRDYVSAVRHLQEGRRIGRLAPAARRSAYLGILNSLTPLVAELGRPQEALDVAEEAVALAQAGWGAGGVPTLVPLARRALVLEGLNRYVDARRDFDEILGIMQREAGQLALNRRLVLTESAAGFRARLNDIDGAQQLIDEGLALLPDPQSLPSWRGRLLRRSALLASAQGQWARAEQLHAEARPLIAGAVGAADPLQIATDSLRCRMQLRARLDPRACADALAGLGKLTDSAPVHRVTARLALAAHALQLARPAEESEHLLQAMAAAQSDRGQGLLWQPLSQLALQLRRAGRNAEAVALAKAAVERIEAPRAQFVNTSDLSTAYLSERQAVYRHLADWLVADQRAEEAQLVLQLLKGQEYRGFVQGRLNALPVPASRLRWTAAERRWLDAMPLASSPGPLRRDATAMPTMRDIAAAEQARAAGWRSALQRPLLADAGGPSRPAGTDAPATATATATATRIDKARAHASDTLQATVFLGPDHVNFILRSAAGEQIVRLPLETGRIARELGDLLARMERRAEVLPLLQSLHASVAAPIDELARRSGARRVQLRLDGELRYLPFAALHDGSGHLVERYVIEQQVPGTGDTPPLRSALRSGAGGARVQAFGSTRAAAGLPALPGVATEICGIVDGPIDAGPGAAPCPREQPPGAMPGQGWLDDAFTAERLRQAAASPAGGRLNLLHIGAHFVLRPGEIGRSWLHLGQGQRLQLDELLTWPWGAQDLVTLSACQTGQGGGGEVEGLSNLMLGRGAGAVIASLWRVEDRSTAALMRSLYRHIHAGVDPAAALRLAQLQAMGSAAAGAAESAAESAAGESPGIGTRPHPFHWAGFFLSQRAP